MRSASRRCWRPQPRTDRQAQRRRRRHGALTVSVQPPGGSGLHRGAACRRPPHSPRDPDRGPLRRRRRACPLEGHEQPAARERARRPHPGGIQRGLPRRIRRLRRRSDAGDAGAGRVLQGRLAGLRRQRRHGAPATASLIDATAIRLQHGADAYLQTIIGSNLEPNERVELSRSYRSLRETFSGIDAVAAVNEKLAGERGDNYLPSGPPWAARKKSAAVPAASTSTAHNLASHPRRTHAVLH